MPGRCVYPHMKRLLCFLIGAIFWPGTIMAHPVIYKDGVALMTWNQPFLNDVWAAYSFRSDMAGVARAMRMKMPKGDAVSGLAQFDYLLQRWNGKGYQANIFPYAAVGGARLNRHAGVAGLLGLEADAESRRWYVSGRWESMFADRLPDFHQGTGRVGIAPYEAEFDQIATWLMVQGEWHPGLTRKWTVTPLLRLFYKQFLIEGGVSIHGDWMANAMVHF